jgi:hypothetical protein
MVESVITVGEFGLIHATDHARAEHARIEHARD